jgi:phosphoglycolate phosphatase-like HAD superfamily hydrolase
MKRRLVLFDIDGTILLSAGAGKRAIYAALASEVEDTTIWDGIRFDGKTDPQIVTEMLTAAGQSAPASDRLQVLCDRYVGMLERELEVSGHRTRVLPGVMALLDRLEQEAGVVLGLLTGNIAPGAALKLRAGRIDPLRFRVGAYGSDSAHRPELPPIAAARAEPFFGRRPVGEEIVIIGDTPSDVTCGQPVGARVIAVATGSYGRAELVAAGASAAFEDLSPTDAVLEAILR